MRTRTHRRAKAPRASRKTRPAANRSTSDKNGIPMYTSRCELGLNGAILHRNEQLRLPRDSVIRAWTRGSAWGAMARVSSSGRRDTPLRRAMPGSPSRTWSVRDPGRDSAYPRLRRPLVSSDAITHEKPPALPGEVEPPEAQRSDQPFLPLQVRDHARVLDLPFGSPLAQVLEPAAGLSV